VCTIFKLKGYSIEDGLM